MSKKGREADPESMDDRAYIASLIGRTPALVMDVGAGACACQTLVLARQGFRVLAIDQDAKAIRGARKTIARARLSRRVRCVQADAAKLPLSARSTDAVVAYSALHHATRLGAVVRSIATVLRPNGRLIVGDVDEKGNGFLRRLIRALRASFRRIIITPRGDWRVYVCEQPWAYGPRGGMLLPAVQASWDGDRGTRRDKTGT